MYGADQVVADIIFVKVNGLLKYRIACGRAGNDRASSRRIERAIDRKHDGKDCSDLPLKTATKGPVKRYIMPSAKKIPVYLFFLWISRRTSAPCPRCSERIKTTAKGMPLLRASVPRPGQLGSRFFQGFVPRSEGDISPSTKVFQCSPRPARCRQRQ
jgi:hypothetical protein